MRDVRSRRRDDGSKSWHVVDFKSFAGTRSFRAQSDGAHNTGPQDENNKSCAQKESGGDRERSSIRRRSLRHLGRCNP